MESEASILTDI